MSKKLLGLRMPDKLLQRLQAVADERSQSANQMAILAITEWLQTLAYSQKLRFMIITKDFFARLLELVDEQQIKLLAEEMTNLTAEIFRDILNIPLSRTVFKDFYKFLPEFMCGSGLRWFEDLKAQEKKGRAILKGFHYMGIEFSKFFTYLSQNLLIKYFEYNLIEETIDFTPNSVFLEFEPIKKE